MSKTERPPRHYPKIGMRNIKTATAAALCALVYYFLDRSPAFACIGAIFGMGSDLEQSKLHGGNRLFGTVIGGLLGIALFRVHLIFYPEGGRTLLLVPLVCGPAGICRRGDVDFGVSVYLGGRYPARWSGTLYSIVQHAH